MATASDDSCRSATTQASGGDDDRKKVKAVADDIDEDELFELDIALLDGRGDGHSAAAVADDDAGHALLANCLLPLRSVSSAVPVDASSVLSSSSYPYSGYYSPRRPSFTGGVISRRFFLGRPGNSARFCFSTRGFETYFQRY
ncbi:hypothetical protein BAE44_0007199 [Dichanthelium oligosanthes]|uniref:Uncharacterized protein n=1 Tax=Dichanthelium oligosanthes TaxID=888268 RepID=A0A1E5W3B3_9POAL|nr:hypothetical protein BAE44_0007199 [Dichanthelium oligosanthes]